MRFTALLLLATLVGALVCAQDTTTNDIQAATAKSSLSQSMIEKSFLLADKAFDGAEDKANERIQDGKQLAEGAADFIQKLRKILLDPRKFGFLSI
ncbi:extracellular glycoprotein lacritin isoform 3-T3 [Glossophaga mutica]